MLGLDVQPPEDSLSSFTVELPVVAFTDRIDSIPSFNGQYKYIGSNNDPVFGNTDIGLYVNANTSVTNFTFTQGSILKSAEIVLALDPLDFAGQFGSTMTYSVYPLDSSLSTSRVYYTSNNRLHHPVQLGGPVNVRDTVIDGVLQIRVPVDNAYATAMMNDQAALQSNATFQAKYKGFYVVCHTTSEGAIYKADLAHEISGFYLNYYTGSTAADSVSSFKFSFVGENAVRFNTVKYTPSSAAPQLQSQLAGDTLSGAPLFVKGMGVTRASLYIPGLEFDASQKRAVSRAEIVFNLDPSFQNATVAYHAPTALSLLPVATSGYDTVAVDQVAATDNARYNGYFDQAGQRYTFNIARQVQAVFNGRKHNYGFHLVVSNPDLLQTALQDADLHRVVLAGTASSLKPVLRLTYVVLEKR